MKEEPEGRVHIRIAGPADIKYVYPILKEMESSAKARGTGIAKRSPQALCQKIYEGKAVIALADNGDWAGFSYIESWSNDEFVSNSGLIVNPAYRGAGVARAIKEEIFDLSRRRYPRGNSGGAVGAGGDARIVEGMPIWQISFSNRGGSRGAAGDDC